MSLLSIDQNKGKACGICVQSCPISIIESDTNDHKPFVSAEKEPYCVLVCLFFEIIFILYYFGS